MANALFDIGRNEFLKGSIAWLSNTFKVMMIDHGVDTPNVSTDDFRNDITGGAVIATSGALTTPSATNGIADADDVTITSVSGASVESLVIYKDTGSSATDNLLVYIDTATGLPFTPNGGNVQIVWASTTNKIFKL
jgi:hypothetical protein